MPQIKNKQIIVTSDFDVNSRKIINMQNPTNDQDGATKNYVDLAIAVGIKWQNPVIDIVDTLPTPGSTFLLDGDRYILSTDDSINTYNGSTWDTVAADEGFAVWVVDDINSPVNDKGWFQYNGSEWVYIGQPNYKSIRVVSLTSEVEVLDSSVRFIACEATGLIYVYTAVSTETVDGTYVLNTLDGGTSRYIAIGSTHAQIDEYKRLTDRDGNLLPLISNANNIIWVDPDNGDDTSPNYVKTAKQAAQIALSGDLIVCLPGVSNETLGGNDESYARPGLTYYMLEGFILNIDGGGIYAFQFGDGNSISTVTDFDEDFKVIGRGAITYANGGACMQLSGTQTTPIKLEMEFKSIEMPSAGNNILNSATSGMTEGVNDRLKTFKFKADKIYGALNINNFYGADLFELNILEAESTSPVLQLSDPFLTTRSTELHYDKININIGTLIGSGFNCYSNANIININVDNIPATSGNSTMYTFGKFVNVNINSNTYINVVSSSSASAGIRTLIGKSTLNVNVKSNGLAVTATNEPYTYGKINYHPYSSNSNLIVSGSNTGTSIVEYDVYVTGEMYNFSSAHTSITRVQSNLTCNTLLSTNNISRPGNIEVLGKLTASSITAGNYSNITINDADVDEVTIGLSSVVLKGNLNITNSESSGIVYGITIGSQSNVVFDGGTVTHESTYIDYYNFGKNKPSGDVTTDIIMKIKGGSVDDESISDSFIFDGIGSLITYE